MAYIIGKLMHQRLILAIWKNFSASHEASEFCWQIALNSPQHLRPLPKYIFSQLLQQLIYIPRGAIVKVYREYVFLLTPFTKKTTVQKPVQNLNCHNCRKLRKESSSDTDLQSERGPDDNFNAQKLSRQSA